MIFNLYNGFVIGLLITMTVINSILAFLNLLNQKQPLPKIVKGIYSQEKHRQAKQYYAENSRFNLLKSLFDLALLLALFLFDFFPWLANLISGLTDIGLLQSFIFFSVLLVGSSLLGAPWNYYKTFYIEEKYGFNKMTRKLFVTDIFRNLLVSTMLVSGIGVLLQGIYEWLGSYFVLGAWITLSILLIVLFTLNTKVFVKIFNKLTPIPEGSLKTSIQALAAKTGFTAKAIYSMDASKRSTKLNAFFSGFGPIREIALFDTLLAKLKEDEILAVLAHEIGHAKHFDEIRTLIQQIFIFGLYALIINLTVSNVDLAAAFGFNTPYFPFGLILFSILIEPIDFLLGIPVNYLSRKAEYAADAFAVKQGYKQSMISALKVLVNENFANLTPHPLQVMLTYSHPTMSLRLEAIEKLKG